MFFALNEICTCRLHEAIVELCGTSKNCDLRSLLLDIDFRYVRLVFSFVFPFVHDNARTAAVSFHRLFMTIDGILIRGPVSFSDAVL